MSRKPRHNKSRRAKRKKKQAPTASRSARAPSLPGYFVVSEETISPGLVAVQITPEVLLKLRKDTGLKREKLAFPDLVANS